MGEQLDTYLVTGGAGFLGSCLVKQLVLGGLARVVTLDLLTYAGHRDNLAELDGHEAHTFVQGDIGDRALVARLMAEHQVRGVINLAAETHVDRSVDAPGAFVRTNVVGTFELLEASRAYVAGQRRGEAGRFRFLQVSTDEVYGSLGLEGAFDESSPYRPRSPYAASKASADHLVRSYAHTFGLPTIVTTGSNTLGPRQFPEKLVPLMVQEALAGRPLPVYGRGDNVRDWLFVDDHARGLWAAVRHGAPGETYALGAGNELRNIELVTRICALLDELSPRGDGLPHASQIAFVEDRPGHDLRYAQRADRARRELGWAPQVAIDEALRATVRWYVDHRSFCAGYERRRLGLGGAPR